MITVKVWNILWNYTSQTPSENDILYYTCDNVLFLHSGFLDNDEFYHKMEWKKCVYIIQLTLSLWEAYIYADEKETVLNNLAFQPLFIAKLTVRFPDSLFAYQNG